MSDEEIERVAGHFVGSANGDNEDEPFDETMKRLTIELDAQFRELAQLEQLIRASLQELDSEE